MAKPKFLNNKQEITKARIGTLMHLCLQRLNERKIYTYELLQNEVDTLVQNEIITKQESEKININQLLQYTKSNIFYDLKDAKEIYKEQAFYTSIKANEIYDTNIEDRILVQGIIDLYYIDKNNNIILVDYKTDYVKDDGKELIERYKSQLSLYKKAIEEALEKRVYKTYIYSTFLGKSIEIRF